MLVTQKLINEAIVRINNNLNLTPGDRRAQLDELLKDWPRHEDLTGFDTEMIVLPGGYLRAISVAGEVVKLNADIPISNTVPMIQVFSLHERAPEQWADASPMNFADQYWAQRRTSRVRHQTLYARHIDVLGPSRVQHDPENYIGGLPRRNCAMLTQAPLRVFLDTASQMDKWFDHKFDRHERSRLLNRYNEVGC